VGISERRGDLLRTYRNLGICTSLKGAGFYDGIEGYEMLKRGMTDDERIANGYYVGWQIADGLEGRLVEGR